ncbi:MAG: SLATT domain-containing protein [Burkholderiales bacterium]
MQVKRFRELAAAYAVAAHEIGLAQAELAAVAAEDQWSQFVADTEHAFSREHTHWIARKR